jgi:putative ABC transport system substrate-binding protein
MHGAALAAGLLAWPLAAAAQPAGKVPVVGYLFAGPRDCKMTPRDEALYQGLRELGYVRGQTITVDKRCYLTGEEARATLSEFVGRQVDVLVVGVPAAALAARAATRDIPIVCASCGDPLANGLATSLARPGGNVTGLASQSAELIGKRVDLLKEAIPGLSRVAALLNPDNPGTRATVAAIETAARASGLQIQRVEFRGVADLERAFRSAATGGARAVLVQDDPYTFAGRAQIAELGLRHRLVVAAGTPDLAVAGVLMAYGPDRVESYRRVARFVVKLLQGARAGDLPFEQPTKYDLVINLRTTKALGVTIPPALLLRADRIIE